MKNTSLKTDLEKGLFKTFMNRINWGDEGVTNYVMTKVLVHNKALETLLNLKDKKIMEQIASNVEEVNGIITGDKSLLFPMIKKCKVAPSGLRFLPHDVEEIATGLTSITELKNFQKLKSLEVFRLKGENNFEFPASCSTLTLLIQEGKHSMPQTSLPGIKDLIFSNKEFQGYVDNLESDIDVHGIIKCFPTAEKIIFECPHKNRIQILSYLFEDLKTLKSLTIKGKPNQMAEIKALKNLKAETINSDTIKITRE